MGYLPELAMRRIADLHPGQAKTDARDATIIAEAARSMPHTLRSVELDDETLAELGVRCGFDDDLAGQITATSNRIRGLLTQTHPALERALGPHLDHPAGGSAHPPSDSAGVEDYRPGACESAAEETRTRVR